MTDSELIKMITFQSAVHEVEVYGLILVELSGSILSWNRGASQLLGYEEADVMGRHFELIFIPEDRAMDIPRQEMARALDLGYCYDDRWHLRKDGNRLYVNGGLCLLKTAEGRPFGYVKIIRNQTEKKEHLETIEQLNAKLTQANRQLEEYASTLEDKIHERTRELNRRNAELQDFCYSIAHDLRAPLRSIQAMAQVVIEDYGTALNSGGIDYLNRISQAGRQLDQLTLDLLAYTRFSREDITLIPIDLDRVVAEVTLGMEEIIRQKHARVTVRKPFLTVLGQHAFTAQILGNFLSNALKFVEPGQPPVVELWAETDGRKVRVYVKDNGIGVSLEYQARIFLLFERLHAPGTFDGTGAGLAIAKKAAERMKGDVGVSSEPGKGSIFWLELECPP